MAVMLGHGIKIRRKLRLRWCNPRPKKQWIVFLYNSSWNNWIQKTGQHTLYFRTPKPWRGSFSVNDRGYLYLEVSDDFINGVADANTLEISKDNKSTLVSLQMKDSTAAIRAVVNCVKEHPPIPPVISGTGFFVASNLVVTNNHVVNECKQPVQTRYAERVSYRATVSGQDNTNDLALLRTEMPNLSLASFRDGPQLGEPVAVYGFPYSDLLSPNFTLGNVTSLSGIRGDTRFLQISAPVQPGNSGGPLIDMSGNVLGIVGARRGPPLSVDMTAPRASETREVISRRPRIPVARPRSGPGETFDVVSQGRPPAVELLPDLLDRFPGAI